MDPLFLIMLVVLVFLIFTMFRRNKKAQAEAQERKSSMAPGQEVMTSYGLFGTVVSVDAPENKVVLELSPGNTATVHLQSVTKILDPAAGVPAADDVVADDAGTVPTAGPADIVDRPLDGRVDGPRADEVAGTPSSSTRGETPEETLRRLDERNENNNR